MLRLRNIFALILLLGVLWYFYGETYEQTGVQGVYNEIRTDIMELKENPALKHAVITIKDQVEILIARITSEDNTGETPESKFEKTKLHMPSNQSFSIYTIEIGDTKTKTEQFLGEPKRTSINEYGVEWNAYHDQYRNFVMVAYNDENKVAGLYTNQDLLASTVGITFDSSRESVLSILEEPLTAISKGLVRYQLQDNGEYHTFFIDDNYVTIFYDLHENNTVTAIQIISDELEQKKEDYFAVPNEELKEGLEYQLFDLTNAARVVHGLSPLSWEEKLRTTARDHSIDMAVNNYFSHTNLEGQSPFDRMLEDDIVFRIAGENLATGQPSSIFAHEGLMNSLGHRENILKSDFRSLAVGVAFNENAQPFYTAKFITK